MKHDSEILKQVKSYFMRRKSAVEAHDFEREIERDAFLYEAVEGFEEMHMSDLQQALDELEERINRQASATVIDKVNWRIAAMIAVILAAGCSFILIGLNMKNEPTVAKESTSQEKLYKEREAQADFAVLPDSINIIEYTAYTDTSKDDVAHTEQIAIAANEPIEKKIVEAPELKKNAEKPTPTKTTSKDVDSAVALNETQATSEQNNELSTVTIESDYAIVTQNSTRSVPQLDQAPIQKTKEKTQTAPATPSNGNAGYQRYIASNLIKTEAMTSGTVTLSFEFDKNGHPKKINVDKSLCEACDKEAIRLIENGPTWSVEDKKERVNYTITIP